MRKGEQLNKNSRYKDIQAYEVYNAQYCVKTVFFHNGGAIS